MERGAVECVYRKSHAAVLQILGQQLGSAGHGYLALQGCDQRCAHRAYNSMVCLSS
jgi:hypothetical protein